MGHVGRYAPSPTGDLHVGNARTALLAWLWARGERGRFLLRIEDLDPERTRPLASARLLEHLAAIGIDWDDTPVRQSQRGELYEQALEQLEAAGLVYPCFCTRADVRAAALAPHGEIGPSYPGTCRQLEPQEGARRLAAGRRASLRFRSQDGTDDHVLRRSDGVVGYQLAVVVDDGAQGITRVLRGDDLASSTPRQIELWRALGLGAVPRYLHVPLVLDRHGRRLGKRNASLSIGELLAAGVSPERLVGWLAWSAGIVPTAEPVPARELIGSFREDALTHEPTLLGDDFFA
jgi:glutamyl-tRNA synthetase